MKLTRRLASPGQSLRLRLALSYLAVMLVGMGLIAPLTWLGVERVYLNNQTASLLAQAELVASALGSQASQRAAADPTPGITYSQATNALPGIHTRVIDAQGGVVIELAAPGLEAGPASLPLPQLALNAAGDVSPVELMSRPEIVQALQGKPATAVRQVEAAGGKRVLYATAPVLAEDGSVAQIVYLATPLPDTQWGALPALLRWLFLGVILAAFLLASWTALMLGQRIVHPLDNLVEAVQAVGEGDLRRKVPEEASIRELVQLGKAFNAMTANLNQSDQAKTAFISDVTHELRTPLTVIKGTIETLQDGALDDLAARGPFLEAMNKETERLIRLVNDLLVLTRADAGALNLQLQRLDLGSLARQRCERLEQVASHRKVRIVVIVEPPVGWDGYGKIAYTVMADSDRLSQVIDNLLDNAIRYSKIGGIVTVRLKRMAERVVCAVEDKGTGIPAQHLPFIFERFYRADPARGRGQGGSGLGLAIVRSLAQAHAGGVSAESVEGEGSVISFWVPAG